MTKPGGGDERILFIEFISRTGSDYQRVVQLPKKNMPFDGALIFELPGSDMHESFPII